MSSGSTGARGDAANWSRTVEAASGRAPGPSRRTACGATPSPDYRRSPRTRPSSTAIFTRPSALGPPGTLILATFADDGPPACSGLPVARYSPARLAGTLNHHADTQLAVLEERREQHRTPWGASQTFIWIALTRART